RHRTARWARGLEDVLAVYLFRERVCPVGRDGADVQPLPRACWRARPRRSHPAFRIAFRCRRAIRTFAKPEPTAIIFTTSFSAFPPLASENPTSRARHAERRG